MKNYIVYKTTHLESGREYIGIHVQEGLDFDGYLGSGLLLRRAIRKHGSESFVRETLFVFDNLSDAKDKEKEIVNLEYVLREDTYNISIGGTGGYTTAGHTERERDEIQKKRQESIRAYLNEQKEKYNGSCYSPEEIAQFKERSRARVKTHPHTIPNNKNRVHTTRAMDSYRAAGLSKRGKYMHITNGETTLVVCKQEYEQLPDGWRRGRGSDVKKFERHTNNSREKIANHQKIKGVICYTDGEKNLKLLPGQPAPDGFRRGMTQRHDKKWITNGKVSMTIKHADTMPDGFYPGRTVTRKKNEK
jgi:hypothetical protein